MYYNFYFSSWQLIATCFGCYLHPSSGAQLQRTAIGFVSVENRGFTYYQVVWRFILCGFVCTRFLKSRVIFYDTHQHINIIRDFEKRVHTVHGHPLGFGLP
jgi:hypothetical protein